MVLYYCGVVAEDDHYILEKKSRLERRAEGPGGSNNLIHYNK